MADNFDLDLHTPNGKAATHSLAIIQTYPLSSHAYESEVGEIKRIKWEQMSDPIPEDECVFTYYKGNKKPPLLQIPNLELPEDFINKQKVSWNRADEDDLTFIRICWKRNFFKS